MNFLLLAILLACLGELYLRGVSGGWWETPPAAKPAVAPKPAPKPPMTAGA
jgi:hypothetical protein